MSEKWNKAKGELKDGMILRVKIGNKEHPRYGEYQYGICNGGGFGCNASGLGNAVYTDFESSDLGQVLSVQNIRATGGEYYDRGSRWERFWDLEILEQDEESPASKDSVSIFNCAGCKGKFPKSEAGSIGMFSDVEWCKECSEKDRAEREAKKQEEGEANA